MAITWNTGAVKDDGNTAAASQTITIPAGVLAGDVLLFVVTGWAGTSVAADVIQASSTGTTPSIIGSTQTTTLGGIFAQGASFSVVASAADAGKVITVSYVSGHTAKWTIALGAWTGASNSSPVDVSGTANNSGTNVSITCPVEVTTVAGDWAIQLVSCSLQGSAYTGGAGYTQRESDVNASSGGGAFIYDSNGGVGSAGSNAGGAVFSNAGGNTQFIGWTVALAPNGVPGWFRQQIPPRPFAPLTRRLGPGVPFAQPEGYWPLPSTAINEDASTPAIKTSAAAQSSVTTASFSPPANSLLVVLLNVDYPGGGPSTFSFSISDSASGSYTAGPSVYPAGAGSFCACAQWFRYVSSAPGPITVTATDNNGLITSDIQLAVRVVMNASSTQPGGTVTAGPSVRGSAGAAMTASLTTTVPGSWVYLAQVEDPNDSGTTPSAATRTLTGGEFDDVTNTLSLRVGAQQPSATVTPGATTFGWTASAGVSPFWSLTGMEILPAGSGPATQAPAGLAAATGTAQPPVPLIEPNTGLAAATVTAQPPVPLVEPNAGVATGTGTAQPPVPLVEPNAGVATGTGTAQPPVPSVTAFAGLAAATVTAQPPVPLVEPNAGVATGTGTAQPPVPLVEPNAGVATGTGTAQPPVPSVTAFAGLAAATGTAEPPVPSVKPSAGLAAGAGTAQPTAFIYVPAGLAAAAGTSQPPVPTVTPPAGLAPAVAMGGPGGSSGPVTISSGGTYTGTFISLDSTVAAVTISTTAAVTLDRCTIYHAGTGVGWGTTAINLTVKNCTFTALPPSTAGVTQNAILLGGPANTDIEHNEFDGGHGIYIDGLGDTQSSLVISYNNFTDISKQSQTASLVGAIHGNHITAPNGASIMWNRCTNHYGSSQSEDVISFTNSNGAAGNLIVFAHNLINGSYPYTGNGASFTGSGTDNGDLGCTYILCQYSTAVRYTNIGFICTSGSPGSSNITVDSCTAIATGYSDNGTQCSSTFGNGVASYLESGTAGTGLTISNCTAGHLRWNGTAWERADFSFGIAGTDGGGNTSLGHDPTNTDVAAAIAAFETSVVSAGVIIGPLPFTAIPEVTAFGGLATGTGVAEPPTVSTSGSTTANAGLAIGTGISEPPVPVVRPNAGLAAATGTAQPPVPSVTAFAGLAAGTGTAQPPVPMAGPAAGPAAGTGAAPPPVPLIKPNAGLATGTGTAQPPVPLVEPSAGQAAGTGTAQAPVPLVEPNAGLAAGTGVAVQPSVSTSGSTTANAGLAAGTGTAQPPVPSVTAFAGLAAAAGTAQAPAPLIQPAAGLAAGTGTAQPPVLLVKPSAGLAAGTGTAQPTAFAYVLAGLAAGTGTAVQPSVVTAAAVVKGFSTAAVTELASMAASAGELARMAAVVTELASTAASTGEQAGMAASVTQPASSQSGVS